MSDVFWAALIGAGSAVLSAWLTNRFNARTTAMQLEHSSRQSALDWQRTEAVRKAEHAKADAHRREELQYERLREFCAWVLECRMRMFHWIL